MDRQYGSPAKAIAHQSHREPAAAFGMQRLAVNAGGACPSQEMPVMEAEYRGEIFKAARERGEERIKSPPAARRVANSTKVTMSRKWKNPDRRN